MLVTAFLAYNRPAMTERIFAQLKGAKTLVGFFNGIDPRAVVVEELISADGGAVISSRNISSSNGVNRLMNHIIGEYPECDAVFLCVDDILGVSPQMGQTLYEDLLAYPKIAMVHAPNPNTCHPT